MILCPPLLTEALFGSFLRVPANSELYKVVFPSALTVTHLALAAAASLALTAGLLRRSRFWVPFALAQRIFRAFASAFTSLRLWAADM